MTYEARSSDSPPVEKATQVEGRHMSAFEVKGLSSLYPAPSLLQGGQQMDRCIKKILVPTDFSPCSQRAINLAVSLAQQCQANLTILHVVDINTQSPGESLRAVDLMKRLWETGFEQMGKLAFSLSGQVDAQTVIEEGLPWEQIVEKSFKADMVILGKPRPKSGFKPFCKNTAQRVIENAACPVVVVPERD